MAKITPTILAVLTAATVAGCASQTKPASLTSAETEVRAARDTPAVAAADPLHLQQAEDALANAELAAKNNDGAMADHHAFVARADAAIAKANTERRQAVQQREALSQERTQLQLQARTSEAQSAEREAQELRQQAQHTAHGTVVASYDLLFDSGSAALTAGGQRKLQPLVDFARRHPDEKITIEGFTDSAGSADTNQRLSQQRAQAVVDYLASAGVPANQLSARGLGESYPVANNATPAGRQQNRRVEVLVGELPAGQ